MNCNWLFSLKKIQNIFSPSGSPNTFPYRFQSLSPTSGDTQPTTLCCPDVKIGLSHAPTITASWSWTPSHAAQVSVLPSICLDIYTDFPNIWKCWFHPKPSELVFLHVLATSLGAIVLHDVKGKEMVSWLTHFTNQDVAWDQNTVTVPFRCTSHPRLRRYL